MSMNLYQTRGFLDEFQKLSAAISPQRYTKNLNLGKKAKPVLKHVGPEKLRMPPKAGSNPAKFSAPML